MTIFGQTTRFMRKLIFAAMLLLTCANAGAQAHKSLDSLKYILPEFTQGTVIFADRHFDHGMINISPLDQGVYCLSAAKDTLFVDNNASIISVSVSGRSFKQWKGFFVEIMTKDADTGVGLIRSTEKVNNVKKGAYGMNSATASIKQYSVDARTGNLLDLIIDDPRNFVYSKTACLIKDGNFLPVSKKSFQKLFPAKKDYIESVWPGLNLSSTDFDAVLSFYNELRQE